MATPPLEHATFWREPILGNTEMLRATYVTHAFSRHTHDGYAIGVIESGVETFTYRGSAYHAPAGSVVIVHPGEVHTGHAGVPDGWSYRMLYPSPSLLQQAATEVKDHRQGLPFFPNPVIQDAAIAAQLRRMHWAMETSNSQLEKESRFLWVLAQLIRQYADSPLNSPLRVARSPDHTAVRRVHEYLNENYASSISLDQLAHLANLKPLRLLRVFQKEMGLPPHAYLIQVRVGRAKQLLEAGLPIAQVAYDTGFTDQSHLNRHFKRLVGVTPGQYASGCLYGRSSQSNAAK